MMRSAREVVSAWASVLATTNATPWSPALIMLLTALPPAPPTPNTVIRGFSSLISGIFKLMLMAASLLRRRSKRQRVAGPPPAYSGVFQRVLQGRHPACRPPGPLAPTPLVYESKAF